MRARAVADDNDPRASACFRGGGDERAAAEALVVGMRRDHERTAGSKQIVEGGKRQSAGGGEKGGQRSCGRSAPAAPLGERESRALRQRPVGPRLPEIGREIASHALDRMRAQEGGEADRPLHALDEIERGALHRRTREVHIGRDRLGALVGRLGDLRRALDPEPRGFDRDRGLAEPGELVRVAAAACVAQMPARPSMRPSMPPSCAAAKRQAPPEKSG